MRQSFALAVTTILAFAAPGSAACCCKLVISPTGTTNNKCSATVSISLKCGKTFKAVCWYQGMQIGTNTYNATNTVIFQTKNNQASLKGSGAAIPAGKSKVTVKVILSCGKTIMNTLCVCFQLLMDDAPPAPTPYSGAEEDNGGEEDASIKDFLCPAPLKYPVHR